MSETGNVLTVVVVAEEAATLGEEVVVIESLIVVMAEVLIEGDQDIQGHHVDAIHGIEAHSEELQENPIPMYPVAAEDHDEITGQDRRPPYLAPHLPYGQTLGLVHRRVAVNGLPRDHALHLPAGDLDRLIDERTHIEAVVAGEEEEVQTEHLVEDHPLLREHPARALQGHLNAELPQNLSVHLLRPDLDGLVATVVLYLGRLLHRLAGHLAGEYLAAEKGLIQLPRRTLRRTP
jgi:hypothetical protein